MKRIALYAGSFDPPTNGHLWMIRRGAEMFDELVVTLAVNPDKRGFLPAERRLEALRSMVRDLPNVRVASVANGFLVDYAEREGARFLLRGIRNTIDFEYEKIMARMNARMAATVQSVFLVPPGELEEISSSVVRGFLKEPGCERWVRACVPDEVATIIAGQNPFSTSASAACSDSRQA